MYIIFSKKNVTTYIYDYMKTLFKLMKFYISSFELSNKL